VASFQPLLTGQYKMREHHPQGLDEQSDSTDNNMGEGEVMTKLKRQNVERTLGRMDQGLWTRRYSGR